MENKPESKMALDEFFANGGTVEEFWGKVVPMDDFLKDLAGEAHEHVEELTEFGAALRLSKTLDGRFVWCPVNGWYAYDELSGVWSNTKGSKDAELSILLREATLSLRKTLKEESKKVIGFGEDYIKAHRKFQQDMQSYHGISNAVRFLQSEFRGSWQQFDEDVTKLGVGNGVLQLRNGNVELLEPGPEHFLAQSTSVHYNPDAEAPFWERSLQTFVPDAEVRDFLQRLAGAMLVGAGAREQIVPVLYGTGATGKSTFIDGLVAALGEDYAVAVDPSTLKKSTRDAGGASPDLARLQGARLAYSVESADSVDAEQIKRWSGGEPIVARHLYKGMMEFHPQFTLMMVANAAPTFNERSDGLWRRVAVIGFHQQLPENERLDKDVVKQRFREEAEGILAWAVRGYLAYARHGLTIPDQVKAETATMRSEQDWLGSFLAESTHQADGVALPTKDLYEAFLTWKGRDTAIPQVSHRAFNGLVRDVWQQTPGDRKVGGKTAKTWYGYALGAPVAEPVAELPNENPSATENLDKTPGQTPSVAELPKPPSFPRVAQEKSSDGGSDYMGSSPNDGGFSNSATAPGLTWDDVVAEQVAEPSDSATAEQPPGEQWQRPKLSFTFVDETQPHNNRPS